jgi:hypothetical protein
MSGAVDRPAGNRRLDAYVEHGTGMAYERGVVAWTFDVKSWGWCGQGRDESSALADLAGAVGVDPDKLIVVERIYGDEPTFARDHVPATDTERSATLSAVTAARAGTRALLAACRTAGSEVLEFDNPARVLPSWAGWRTLSAMFWHVADTECRYYFPGLGLPSRPRADDLDTELDDCSAYVHATVRDMPGDLVHRHRDEEWTSTKVLRRLAWHERGELRAMRDLAMANAALLGLRLQLPASADRARRPTRHVDAQ